MSDIEFRRPPPPALPVAEIRAAVIALGLPKAWTTADDVALMEGFGLGLSIEEIAKMQGQTEATTRARFFALRGAATGGLADMGLDTQNRLLDVVHAILEQCHRQSPDDFCRTCRGRGWLDEPQDRNGRTVNVSSACYACHGTGYGR